LSQSVCIFSFSTLILLVGSFNRKTVSQLTYTVLVETLNTAYSINQSVCILLVPVVR